MNVLARLDDAIEWSGRHAALFVVAALLALSVLMRSGDGCVGDCDRSERAEVAEKQRGY